MLKLPKGYFPFADISKHVRKRVEEYWSEISKARQITGEIDKDEFKDALVTYLLEFLIWQFKVPEGEAVSGKVWLWHDGMLVRPEGYDMGLIGSLSSNPCLDDILFKTELSLLDFGGRDNNPLVFSSAYEDRLFADYVISCRSGYDFLDDQTWSVRFKPKSYTPKSFTLEPVERELRQETWKRVKPFAGAILVCAGGSASKIADRALPELKKFFLSTKLPEKKKWQERQVEWAVEKYLELSAEAQDNFALKPKQNFATWLIGKPEAADHRVVTNMWEEFLNKLPPKKKSKLIGRGRRPKNSF